MDGPHSVRAYQNAALGQLVGSDGELHLAKVVPIIADFTWSFDLVIGDLTLGSAAGLGPVITGTWAGPYEDGPGRAVVTAPSITFIATGVTTAISVYGWALLDSAGTGLLATTKYENLIPINQDGDGFTVNVTMPYAA